MLLCGILCPYSEVLLEQQLQITKLAVQMGLHNCSLILIWSEIKVMGSGCPWGHMLNHLDLPVGPA